jgi:hypothetical protein
VAGITGHILVTCIYMYFARSPQLKRPVTKIGHNSERQGHVKCMRAG